MTAHLTVTRAQVLAAQLQLRLADEIGETVTPLVRAIAKARPRAVQITDEHAVVPRQSSNGSLSGDRNSSTTETPGT